MIRTVRRLFLSAAIVALVSAGCAGAKAKPRVEPVALDAPAPPPRVIVPPDPEPIQPPPPAPDPEPKAQKPARRPAPPRSDGKAEPSRASDPPVQASGQAATLQQALPGSPAELARQVHERLTQAQSDLKRVSYKTLGADAKSQYDTAQRFIAQAEQALKQGNLVFAAKVAEKAAGLAASLPLR